MLHRTTGGCSTRTKSIHPSTLCGCRGVAVLVIALAFCTCNEVDSTEDKAAVAPQCDGGNELWIGYQRFAGMGDGGVGNTLFEENGRIYFVINDACRYYAFDGTDGTTSYGRLADIRTGVLTKDEAADIANRLSVQRWPDMFGNQYNEPSLDCGGSTAFGNNGVFSCICGCPSFSEPAKIDDAATEIVSELVVKGVPVNGELRAVSMRYVENCDGWSDSIMIEEVVQFPIDSYNPAEQAVPDCSSNPDTATQSRLLDGDTAQDLRALRKTYREQLTENDGRIEVYRLLMQDRDNAEDIYEIFLRDYIPLENEDGLLQPQDLSALKVMEP